MYVHLLTVKDEIVQDVQRFSKELGGTVPPARTVKETKALKPGTWVTIVVECDEVEFSPSELKKKWEPDSVRYEFDFRPKADLIGETVIVKISVQVEGVEIAAIKNCAIEVVAPTSEKSPLDREPAEPETQPVGSISAEAVLPPNKLAIAKAELEKLKSQTAAIYQHIFVSYSRKDTEVVHAYKVAQDAVGNDVFVDTDCIHAGENWMARLAKEIDEADIFQLFWSENSASSEFVREEWMYALQERCPGDKCVGFIRPVYWTQEHPKPEPPKELEHLHFRYVQFGPAAQ